MQERKSQSRNHGHPKEPVREIEMRCYEEDQVPDQLDITHSNGCNEKFSASGPHKDNEDDPYVEQKRANSDERTLQGQGDEKVEGKRGYEKPVGNPSRDKIHHAGENQNEHSKYQMK